MATHHPSIPNHYSLILGKYLMTSFGIVDLFVHLHLDVIRTVLHKVLIKHFNARVKRVKPWLRVGQLDQIQKEVHLHLAKNEVDGFRLSTFAYRAALHDPLPSQVEIRSLIERRLIQTVEPIQNLVLCYQITRFHQTHFQYPLGTSPAGSSTSGSLSPCLHNALLSVRTSLRATRSCFRWAGSFCERGTTCTPRSDRRAGGRWGTSV